MQAGDEGNVAARGEAPGTSGHAMPGAPRWCAHVQLLTAGTTCHAQPMLPGVTPCGQKTPSAAPGALAMTLLAGRKRRTMRCRAAPRSPASCWSEGGRLHRQLPGNGSQGAQSAARGGGQSGQQRS